VQGWACLGIAALIVVALVWWAIASIIRDRSKKRELQRGFEVKQITGETPVPRAKEKNDHG